MMAETLQVLTSLILGLFVGSLLTEGTILVPYWRTLEPKTFLELHPTLGPKLYRYFAPLTITATLLPTVTAAVCVGVGSETRWHSVVVAGLVLLILGIYFVYFKAANASFETGAVGVDGLPAELKRWATWHGLRTVIGMIAFLISLLALVNP